MSVVVKGNADYTNKQPNIIYILADDLGNADVGFTKAGAVKTPHLDKLANEGLRRSPHIFTIFDSFLSSSTFQPSSPVHPDIFETFTNYSHLHSTSKLGR